MRYVVPVERTDWDEDFNERIVGIYFKATDQAHLPRQQTHTISYVEARNRLKKCGYVMGFDLIKDQESPLFLNMDQINLEMRASRI